MTASVSRRVLLGTTAALAVTAALPMLCAEAAGPGGELTVGVPTNLTGLDPADVNDTLSQSACKLMMQGLYGFDKDMGLIPMLAESYTANDDATAFTFKLRTGIEFHDGTRFDAEAVRANFVRILDPANHLKRTSLYNMIDQVVVVDPATVTFKLKSPFGAFVPTIAHPAGCLVSPAAITKHGKEINRNPVGTGPFKFVSWSADTLKVTKNDKYWKPGLPKLSGVTFRSVPENGSRIAMLQTGEAQFIYPMPPEMVKVIQVNPDIQLIDAPSIIERYVALNVTRKPFDDIRVRQALNYAVDKVAFTRIVWSGYEDVSDAPIPPRLGFYAKQGSWPHDVAKAKALLAEAGYPDGFESEIWANTTTIQVRTLQFLQQQMAQIGVKLTVTPLEAGLLDQKIWSVQKPEDSQLKMYAGGWSSSTGDADWGLRPLFWGQGFPPKLYNVGYYHNPEVDKNLEAALSTADAAKRGALYKTVQEQVWADAPWIFMGVDHILAAHSRKLTGVYQIPDGGLLIEEGALSA